MKSRSGEVEGEPVFGSQFDAQGWQGICGGALRDFAFGVEARVVTWAGKAIRLLFEGATKMGADQAEGGESAFGVNQKGGDFRQDRARSKRIFFSRAKIEFCFGRGVGIVI